MNMYKYTKSSESVAKIESTIMFEEVATGVYYVVKDRYGDSVPYVSQHTVTTALNYVDKVAVISHRGLITNFQLRNGGTRSI